MRSLVTVFSAALVLASCTAESEQYIDDTCDKCDTGATNTGLTCPTKYRGADLLDCLMAANDRNVDDGYVFLIDEAGLLAQFRDFTKDVGPFDSLLDQESLIAIEYSAARMMWHNDEAGDTLDIVGPQDCQSAFTEAYTQISWPILQDDVEPLFIAATACTNQKITELLPKVVLRMNEQGLNEDTTEAMLESVATQYISAASGLRKFAGAAAPGNAYSGYYLARFDTYAAVGLYDLMVLWSGETSP